METREIPIDAIDVSKFNTRKDLADGQEDSTIEDLAGSIARQGLLSPITVYRLASIRSLAAQYRSVN
jgi:ParB-like chromosome segregation protein Spo0J